MSAITESLNLDVTRRSNIKVIHIKQGDTNSRRITTPILVDGTKQTIVGSSNTALINIRRPDAQQKSFAATINSDNTVTAVIPNFAAEIASTPTRMTVASISIMEGTTVKYETEDFLIDVGKTNEGARGSDSDADILMELIAYTNEAVDRVNSIIDTTTEHMERAEAAAETAEHIADIVDVHKDGYYPSMTVGTSEQLIGDQTTTDSEPYLFRKSAGSGLEKNTLIGGTVAWNQLLPSTTSAKWGAQIGTIESTENSIKLTTTRAEQSQAIRIAAANGGVPIVKGHKCLLLFGVLLSEATSNFKVYVMYNQNLSFPAISADIKTECAKIFESTEETGGNSFFGFYPKYTGTGLAVGATLTVYNPVLFDLTAMFGSTIADYIYSLEQATAGAGVQWIKDNDPKLLEWHPYDAGSLISVKPSAHKMVGKNLLENVATNVTANGITFTVFSDGTVVANGTATGNANLSINPNAERSWGGLILNGCPTGGSNTTYRVEYYDSTSGRGYWDFGNGVTIPNDTNGNVCRVVVGVRTGYTANNLVFKPMLRFADVADATYEPYTEHVYSLGSDELRGIPQLTNGKLSYDGDIKTADGKITRKYGIVDLGTLNWTISQSTENGFYAQLPTAYPFGTDVKMLCSRYPYGGTRSSNYYVDNTLTCYQRGIASHPSEIYIKDQAYTSAASFKAAMSGVYLVYELATPTTEQGTAYSPYQRVSADGTEEFVDERDVPVPVGHDTQYYDVYSKDEMVEQKRIALASFATDTASGTIATFPDGADDIPVKSATFAIVPQQDLNGYDSQWPAGGGKNLWSPTFATAVNASSTVTASGGEVRIETTGTTNYSGMGTVREQDLPAGTYYIKLKLKSGGTLGANAAFGIRNRATNSFFGTKVMTASTLEYSFVATTTADGYFSVLGTWTDGTAADFTIYDVMISTTDTAYEPYENICPITGWTQAKVSVHNKNWLPMPVTQSPYTSAGVTQVENEDGSVTFSGTATANTWRYWNTYNAQGLYNFRFPAGNYRLSSGITGATSRGYRFQMTVYDRATNAIKRVYEDCGSGRDIVIQEDETEAVYLYVPSGKVMDGITLYPMLTRQDDGQTFEKQILDEQTIPFGSTVYGGTLEYLGGESWRLTRTMAYYSLTSASWDYDTQHGYWFSPVISDMASNSGTVKANIASDTYQTVIATQIVLGQIDVGIAEASSKRFIVRNGSTTEAPTGNAIYELATPESYDLTADELRTLLGTNNIWSDTGSAEVEYRADTALYVQKKLG